MDSHFKIIVYRGGTQIYPENSIEAIRESLKVNSHAIIEIDLQLSLDEEVIVFHDFHLDHLTNGQGLINEQNLLHLQKLNVKYPDQTLSPYKIPTLREVFETFPTTYFALDLHEKNDILFEKVIQIVETMNMQDNIVIISTVKGAIQAFQKLRPKWTYMASPQETKKFILANKLGLQKLAQITSSIIFLPEKLGSLNILNRRAIKELHKRSIKVWTCSNYKPYQNVNHLSDLERLKKMEVDGVFTDNPQNI